MYVFLALVEVGCIVISIVGVVVVFRALILDASGLRCGYLERGVAVTGIVIHLVTGILFVGVLVIFILLHDNSVLFGALRRYL